MQLKLVSLNLWVGGILWDQIISFLREQDADILTLQEVYHTQNPEVITKQHRSFSLLSDELDYTFAHFAPAFIETVGEHKIDQGAAVFSKYPLTPQPTVFFDIPYGERLNTREGFPSTPRSLQHVTLELPFDRLEAHSSDEEQPNQPQSTPRLLHVFNTQGIWGPDGSDNDRRLAMAQTIVTNLNAIPSNQLIILAGDFNVKENTKTIDLIESKLNNVFKHQLKTSFNMRRKDDPGYAQAVVDMIFVSPQIKVLGQACPNIDISDHLPLVVTLEL